MQQSINLIKQQNMEILIGDSNQGIDKEIINYLQLSPKYKFVSIYSIKKSSRTIIDSNWNFYYIEPDESLKKQQQQMMKDKIMAQQADYGLAIFNPITINRYGAIQVSSGTLRNTIQMLLYNKPVKFFYLINGRIQVANLKSIADLYVVIDQYNKELLTFNEQQLILSAKGSCQQEKPEMIKFNKINKKFTELLKQEQLQMKQNKDNIAQLALKF